MAGAGYKLYATGDVLTAAQVNNYLQEQTVMVFADAAARTTALASVLAEGMISYLKDTNATDYYSGSAWVALGGSSSPLTTKGDLYGFSTTNARVPVGTNGQILTADSTAATGVAWATAGASYTQISSQALSGSAVNFTSISGTYNKLVLVVQDFYLGTNNENLVLRFNSNNTASAYGLGGVSNGAALSYAQSQAYITYQGIANADNNNMAVIEIENYTNTNSHKVFSYQSFYKFGTTNTIDVGAGYWVNTSAITEINVRASAGTFSGGTAILWGVK